MNMKILCLHGSYGSAKNFEIQLTPFIDALEKTGPVKFKLIDGAHLVTPPTSFENYFGKPPLYRFFDFDGAGHFDNFHTKIRELSEGSTPEETIRSFIGELESSTAQGVKSALDRIFRILDEDPEINGFLGYSEGATLAGTLVLEERRRWEEEGKPRRLKSAIFFGGWPPVRICPDGSIKCVLAECEEVIDVPTCHVVGCRDPYIHGAMALFGMCDEDKATLFDYGKGHALPRDPKTIQELVPVIEETWSKAMQ